MISQTPKHTNLHTHIQQHMDKYTFTCIYINKTNKYMLWRVTRPNLYVKQYFMTLTPSDENL